MGHVVVLAILKSGCPSQSVIPPETGQEVAMLSKHQSMRKKERDRGKETR
jgi:hypothetical protein